MNHVNHTEPGYVHEAVVVWVEEIRENNFTVCVTQAGRNEKKNGQTFATVDWLAYQGECRGRWICRLGGLEQIVALCICLRLESIITSVLKIYLLIKQSSDDHFDSTSN